MRVFLGVFDIALGGIEHFGDDRLVSRRDGEGFDLLHLGPNNWNDRSQHEAFNLGRVAG